MPLKVCMHTKGYLTLNSLKDKDFLKFQKLFIMQVLIEASKIKLSQ